ncbi:MAG: tail fiber domain-containing protein, partial [Verrucomicrobiota bacterium]
YQGRLTDGTNPANGLYDFQSLLFTNPASGPPLVGVSAANPAVGVTNGIFTMTVQFAFPPVINNPFNGQPLWLDLSVRTNGTGIYSTLTPRQKLTPTPYAIYAGTASNCLGAIADSQLSANIPRVNGPANFNVGITAAGFQGDGSQLTSLNAAEVIYGTVPDYVLSANVALRNTTNTFASPVIATNLNNSFKGTFTGNGSALTSLNASQLVSGSIPAGALNNAWKVGGNTGANPTNGAFLGTIDNYPLEIRVNNSPALRVEPTSQEPNIIGNAAYNYTDHSTLGAFIGNGSSNSITGGHDCFIGSGTFNQIPTNSSSDVIAGGFSNSFSTNSFSGFIGSGNYNHIGISYNCVIGGGNQNVIADHHGAATIAGGGNNLIATAWNWNYEGQTIGGGFSNNVTLAGCYGTVPGGVENSVQGFGGFAAGCRAQSLHDGTFVWADWSGNAPASQYPTGAVFQSTGPNQFLIRARGGVGINTNNPNGATLSVNGTIVASGTVTANGVLLTSDRNAKENFTPVDPQSMLAKVATLPITEWNYKNNDDGIHHVGPMAQDFQAAFQLSADDKHISVVDEGGVALAAIQGLNQKVEARSQELESENAALKARLEKLEKLITTLTGGAK